MGVTVGLLTQLRAAGLPDPATEYQFAPPRKWAFDFCWVDRLVAVEVEGGTWKGGRHVRPRGFESDARKYNQAAIEGWTVLRFTTAMVASGEAVAVIGRALGKSTHQGGDHV